jgi:hypothetical protein
MRRLIILSILIVLSCVEEPPIPETELNGPYLVAEASLFDGEKFNILTNGEKIIGVIGPEDYYGDIYLAVSEDGGENWELHFITDWASKIKLGIDADGTIYACWSTYYLTFAKSNDNGNSWQTYVFTGYNSYTDFDMVVTAEGEIFICWIDYNHSVRVSKSLDGGNSWSTSILYDTANDQSTIALQNGTLYVAWNTVQGDIYLAVGNNLGSTWTVQNITEDITGFQDEPELIMGADRNVYINFISYEDEHLRRFYRVDGDQLDFIFSYPVSVTGYGSTVVDEDGNFYFLTFRYEEGDTLCEFPAYYPPVVDKELYFLRVTPEGRREYVRLTWDSYREEEGVFYLDPLTDEIFILFYTDFEEEGCNEVNKVYFMRYRKL